MNQRTGQDGFYQTGCPPEGRFVDHGDGTVTDICTGLMWQKVTADVSGNGSVGNEDRINWRSALKYCNDLDFAGLTDWRLPNVRELQSIADYRRVHQAIDPVFRAESAWYWTSTSVPDGSANAWLVYFGDGGLVYGGGRGHGGCFVRAVRGGL